MAFLWIKGLGLRQHPTAPHTSKGLSRHSCSQKQQNPPTKAPQRLQQLYHWIRQMTWISVSVSVWEKDRWIRRKPATRKWISPLSEAAEQLNWTHQSKYTQAAAEQWPWFSTMFLRTRIDLTRYTETHTFTFDDTFDGSSSNNQVPLKVNPPLLNLQLIPFTDLR